MEKIGGNNKMPEKDDKTDENGLGPIVRKLRFQTDVDILVGKKKKK